MQYGNYYDEAYQNSDTYGEAFLQPTDVFVPDPSVEPPIMVVLPFDPTVHMVTGRTLSPIAEASSVSPASSDASAIPSAPLIVGDDDIAELPMEAYMPPPAPHEVHRRPPPPRTKAARNALIPSPVHAAAVTAIAGTAGDTEDRP